MALPAHEPDGFPEVFRELLERETSRGRLKKQLAHACGMRADYFSHLLSGRRRPTHPEVVTRIANGLQLDERDTARLLQATGFPPTPPPGRSSTMKTVSTVFEQLARRPDELPRARIQKSALAPPRGEMRAVDAILPEAGSVVIEFYDHVDTPTSDQPPAGEGSSAPARDELWRRLLGRDGVPRVWNAGTVIRRAGDPVDSLHLILLGCVAAAATIEAGFSLSCQVLGPGDIFGEASLMPVDDACYSGPVKALARTATVAIDRQRLQLLRRSDPKVAEGLIELLADRVDRLAQRLMRALHASAEQRVWLTLVELAEIFGRGDSPVLLPITQSDLAELAGTARSTAHVALQRASRAGLLSCSRSRIVISNLPALHRLLAGWRLTAAVQLPSRPIDRPPKDGYASGRR